MIVFLKLNYFIFILFLSNSLWANNPACHLVFTKAQKGNASYYLQYSEAKRNSKYHGKRPQFNSISEELQLSTKRTAEEAPAMINSFLPKNVGFIDHRLSSADELGIVKHSFPGNTVMLRAKMNWNGFNADTNILVNHQSLKADFHSNKSSRQYLIHSNNKAVILWFHGGGTVAANSSTALDSANYFAERQVATLALDLPFHGEGARINFRNDLEFADYISKFIDQFIDPNVPVVIAGHSIGASLSMILHKLSNHELLKSRVHAYFALSPAADLSLGRLNYNTEKAEKEIEENRKNRKSEIADTDLEFLNNYLRELKNAPTTLWHTHTMLKYNNWSIPPDKGKNLKPLLAITGKYDGITYVGYEHAYEHYFKNLMNSELVILDKRDTIDGGKNLKVGHSVFKAINPETGMREAYERIQWKLEEVLSSYHNSNIKLDKVILEHTSYKRNFEDQVRQVLLNYHKLWANNLAFREYVNQVKLLKLFETKELNKVKQDLQSIFDFQSSKKELNKLLKNKKITESEFKQKTNSLVLALDVKSETELTQLQHKLLSIINNDFIPSNTVEIKNLEKNISERNDLAKEFRNINAQANKIHGPYIKLVEEYEIKASKLNNLIKGIQSVNIELLNTEVEISYKTYKNISSLYETAITEYFKQLEKSNSWSNPELMTSTPELESLAKKYRKAKFNYQNKLSEFVKTIKNEIISESFEASNREDIIRLANDIWNISNSNNKNSLYNKISEYSKELQRLDNEIYSNTLKSNLLLKEYLNLNKSYYSYKELSLEDILNLPYDQFVLYFKEISQALAKFEYIWEHRSPTDKTDIQP